jgi:hypothetical protein
MAALKILQNKSVAFLAPASYLLCHVFILTYREPVAKLFLKTARACAIHLSRVTCSF